MSPIPATPEETRRRQRTVIGVIWGIFAATFIYIGFIAYQRRRLGLALAIFVFAAAMHYIANRRRRLNSKWPWPKKLWP